MGAASEPARSRSARSRASSGSNPVIWNRFENTPRMVATLMTSSSVRVTSRAFSPCPSVSRFCSMKTTAMPLFRFSRVVSSILRAPLASRLTNTAGWPSWSKLDEAPVSWSPVTMMSRLSSTGWPARSS
jgi:hypothetical protein